MDNSDNHTFFAPTVVEQPALPVEAEGKKEGLFQALLRFLGLTLQSERPTPPPAVIPTGPSFSVCLCPLTGDEEGVQTRHVMSQLEGRTGLRLRLLTRRPKLDNPNDALQLNAACVNARQLLFEEDCALVIWGEVQLGTVISLRFTNLFPLEEEKAGTFSPFTRLDLPVAFTTPLDQILHAVVIAAFEPRTEADLKLKQALLPGPATALAPFATRPPPGMMARQFLSLGLCHAHIQATLALWEKDPPTYVKGIEAAIVAYRALLPRLGANDLAERAVIQRNLAALLMLQSDRSVRPVPLMEEAVEAYRAALSHLNKSIAGQDWGNLQFRLANALYRLETKTARTELLRDAILAYQQALSLYSRTETPQRWAESMHGLALTLQVLGDHLRSPDILKRAVEASEAVLAIWTREATPAGWAAAANTLATALFMLDKHADTTSHLEDAAIILREVITTYDSLGVMRMSFVAQKNLTRVEALLKERRDRKVVDPDWWQGRKNDGKWVD